jgi:uncharacterized protein
MPLLINLRQLERKDVVLEGELPVAELDLGDEELIHFQQPLEYELEAELLDDAILVQGQLRLEITCDCARCLRPIRQTLEFPDWACHLPLEGEEAVSIVNDSVDLTPYLREDILLELPQHPLCTADCAGLPKSAGDNSKKAAKAGQNDASSSAWSELNKLKL